MNLKNQTLLFLTRNMGLGGTEAVVLQMCKILQSEVRKIVVCSTNGINVKVLNEMGIKHYEIPDIERKSPHTILSVLSKLFTIINKEKITVIHTHHRMAAFYVALLSKVKALEFINTSHNTFSDKRAFTRFALRKANLIACGEQVKKNLIDYYGFSEERITVIHNAVEVYSGKINKLPELEKYKNEGYILVGNVGRLSEQKGIDYFIKSLLIVKREIPLIKYVIIGDGEDRDKLIQLSKNLRLENDILFLGYREDVRNIISQLDFVVLSSLWEGLPLTPIEAFSVGKTVIATAVDGTVEIIKNYKNGILVTPRSSNELAEKIIELTKNNETKKLLENGAYKSYCLEFSFDKYRSRVISYYLNL